MVGFRWAQCRQTRPVLWDYASERLSEGPMELVEQHLQTCRACRDEVAMTRRAQQFLSACRACEEPTPRSDWNALRQRMVAQGVTPVPQPSLAHAQGVYGQEPKRRPLYASWQMQLLTSTAGGFAAVLLLGAVYTLRPAPRAPQPATPSLAATRSSGMPVVQAAVVGKGDLADTINAPRRVDDQAKLINTVVKAFADTRALPGGTPSVVLPVHAISAVPQNREQASVKHALPPTAAFGAVHLHSVYVREHDTRIVRSIASRSNGRLRFKPYTPRPQERLRELTSASEGASHYALERVRPVNSESDEAGSYVVGSVRPVSYDESGDY